jgi:hypothetical protein
VHYVLATHHRLQFSKSNIALKVKFKPLVDRLYGKQRPGLYNISLPPWLCERYEKVYIDVDRVKLKSLYYRERYLVHI